MGGGILMGKFGRLWRACRHCIWDTDHGLGDIMVDDAFDVEKVELLLRAFAHSH